MGWCGGTEMFDGALDLFLKFVPPEQVVKVVGQWYDVIAAGDWDCEADSEYYELLRPIMIEKGYTDA